MVTIVVRKAEYKYSCGVLSQILTLTCFNYSSIYQHINFWKDFRIRRSKLLSFILFFCVWLLMFSVFLFSHINVTSCTDERLLEPDRCFLLPPPALVHFAGKAEFIWNEPNYTHPEPVN